MGTDSIWRLLFRFSGPATIAMLVGASYAIVDAIYLGRLGTDVLAAVTISHPIILILLSIEMGTGVGSASLIARRLGAGRQDEASKVAGTTISMLLLIGGVMTAICLPNLNAILRLFGATENVLPISRSYMTILLSFAVVDTFYMGMGHVVRAEGSPVYSSIVHIVAAVTNIILDPLLIFGWGPFPAMGVTGAATATVIARGVGAAMYIVFFVMGKSSASFHIRYFLPRLAFLKEIYRVGFASIVRQGGFSVLMVFVNRVAISFGTTTIAIMGVIFRTNSFARMPTMGIGQGVLPLIGYNYGAGNLRRVGEVFVKAMKASFAWGMVCALAALLFPAQILSVFNSEPEFIGQGVLAMRLFSLVYLTMGMRFNSSAYFQGVGKGFAALMIGLAREYMFIFPLIYIFTAFFGRLGVWITFPVSDVLGALVALVWIIIESRRMGVHFSLMYPRSGNVAILADSPADMEEGNGE